MAYFPNGTAGEVLDDQCSECPVDNEAPCPVLLVQTAYNYSQFYDGGNARLIEAINLLVNEKGICQMKPIIENRLVNKKQGSLLIVAETG